MDGLLSRYLTIRKYPIECQYFHRHRRFFDETIIQFFSIIEIRLSAEIVARVVMYKTTRCPKTVATMADKSIASPRKLQILQWHSHALVWLFIDHVYPAVQTGFRWCFPERSGDLDNSGNPICHSVYPRKIQNWSLRRNRRRKTL